MLKESTILSSETPVLMMWDVVNLHADHRGTSSLVEALKDANKGNIIKRFSIHPFGKFVGFMNDDDFYLLDVSEPKRIQHDSYIGHWIKTTDLAFSPNGKWVAIYGYPPGGDDGLIILDATSGQYLRTLASRNDIWPTQRVSFTNDSQYLASTTCVNNTFSIWETQDFRLVSKLQLETAYGLCAYAHNKLIILEKNAIAIVDASLPTGPEIHHDLPDAQLSRLSFGPFQYLHRHLRNPGG